MTKKCTVKELKEFLANFSDDTEVEVVIAKDKYDGSVYEEPFECKDLVQLEGEFSSCIYSDTWEYTDWSKNRLINNDSERYGTKVLTLGVID